MMDELSQCIEECTTDLFVDKEGNDVYLVKSPEGGTAMVSSHHLVHEKAKYLCSKV
jgi:hypothetical protein